MSRGVEIEKTGTNVQNGGRGRRKCAGETLDFSHLKRPQKASFLIFFHGKVLFYTYSLKTICNFHMTTEKNQIFIAVAGDELSSTIHHVYILRGRRGPVMFRSFSDLG